MENAKVVIDLLTALSYIQVGHGDLENALDDISNDELVKAIEKFESQICSLESISDHHDSEFAVQFMHNRINEILTRIGRNNNDE